MIKMKMKKNVFAVKMNNSVWTMNTDKLFRLLNIIKTTKRLPHPNER